MQNSAMTDLFMDAAIKAVGLEAVIGYFLSEAEKLEEKYERIEFPELYSGDEDAYSLWLEAWLFGQAPSVPPMWSWREDSVDHIDNINMGDLDSVVFDDEFEYELDEDGLVTLPLEGLPIVMDDDGEWVAL